MSVHQEDLESIARLLDEDKPGQVLDYVINMVPKYQREAFDDGEFVGYGEGHACGEEVAYGHGYNDGWHQGYSMGADRAEWEVYRG